MKVAVIIPCFRNRKHILNVVERTLDKVDHVFVVDDDCPEHSGQLVAETFPADKVSVLRNGTNQGVGGATITGYQAALSAGYDILIKLDGDGQMDPKYIPDLIRPILDGEADYTKGNRFFRRDYIANMPILRLLGNSGLSLLSKASSGYWNVMDPTNGYTALHVVTAQEIEFDKVARRYFFESDLLFRLNIARAVVKDVPIPAIYGLESSNLSIGHALVHFSARHVVNMFKRFVYGYILRDFNVGTVQVIIGSILCLFGIVFGSVHWLANTMAGTSTETGTIMLASLPIILGFQLLLAALSFDVNNVPSEPLQRTAPLHGGGREQGADEKSFAGRGHVLGTRERSGAP
jgi:glycosyltransferase involved in cell wall biosynthesis